MKIVTVNPDKCTGCRLCELACSMRNTGEFNPASARLRVIDYDELFCLPVTCFHCEKPYCVEVCDTGAITKDEISGIVKISNQCIGCKMCILACPFGSIFFSSKEDIAVKCELCDGEPECVLFCPTGALEFKEANTATIRKKVSLFKKPMIKDIYEAIIQ